LEKKTAEFNTLAKRLNNIEDGKVAIEEMDTKLALDPDYQLQEPQGFMTAKTYKIKFAEPLAKKLKKLVRMFVSRYYKVLDKYHRISEDNRKLKMENGNLIERNDRLREENEALREQNKDYSLLRKVFGTDRMNDLLWQAREKQQAKRNKTRERKWER
jgi:hypothetical protein